MFEGLELEVMLYDEYVDMILDEQEDDDDSDGDLYGKGGILNTDDDGIDYVGILLRIKLRKIAFYSFSFVGEFTEVPGYSLVSSSGMTFICTMPYAKLRRVVGQYLSARMS